jgi:hypothetical protein
MIYDIMISYIDILQHSSGISQPRRIRSSCPSHGMQDQTQHHLLQRSHHIKSLDATLENEVTGHHFFWLETLWYNMYFNVLQGTPLI